MHTHTHTHTHTQMPAHAMHTFQRENSQKGDREKEGRQCPNNQIVEIHMHGYIQEIPEDSSSSSSRRV